MPTELTWLGHGSWLVETGQHKILLDPFLSDSPTAPVKPEQVEADFILISHGHFDHVADAVQIARRTGATVVAIYEICDWLSKQHGVEKTEPMNLGGGVNLPFGRVKLTPAFHSSTLPDGSSGGNPAGFLLTLAEGRIYFACDTALFSDMKLHAGGVEVAVLPIGDRFTMGPDDALEAVKLIQPRRVVPSHYNTWPPIEQDAGAWAERVRRETKAEPVVLAPGEKISL
jgi:L-ascorbate metabolism protein UlaG (beta-lactamase superfamily)